MWYRSGWYSLSQPDPARVSMIQHEAHDIGFRGIPDQEVPDTLSGGQDVLQQAIVVGAQPRHKPVHRFDHGGATSWTDDDIAPDEAARAECVPAVQTDGELLLIIVGLETPRAVQAVEASHLSEAVSCVDGRVARRDNAKALNWP